MGSTDSKLGRIFAMIDSLVHPGSLFRFATSIDASRRRQNQRNSASRFRRSFSPRTTSFASFTYARISRNRPSISMFRATAA